MKRAWTLAALAIAVLSVGVMLACDASGTKDALRSAAVSTAVAQDQEGPKGCSIIGSWSTDPFDETVPIQWIGTITGQSSSSGEIVVETPVWPYLDPKASVTLRGAWKRTGGNTFEFKQMGWVLHRLNGAPLWYAKNVGTQTITDDCNKMTVVSTMEVVPLFAGLPHETADLPVLVAHRIVVP